MRCAQSTLEGYLRMLETCGPPRKALLAIAGIEKEDWLRWILAEEDAIPSAQQVCWIVAGANLSQREAEHLSKLREKALREAQPGRQPGLAELLAQQPGALGPALARTRARKRFTVDQVAAQAGVPAEAWQSWEDGGILPSLNVLDDALKKIHWIWATDDALRGWVDEVPAAKDAGLWKAFLNDHEWEETLAQENWLLPQHQTPEAVAAWREVQLASERQPAIEPEIEAVRAVAEARQEAESTLAGFLRFRRETKLASVEEMAGKAGVEIATWLAWESGEMVPTLAELEAVAPRIFVTAWLRERLLEVWHAMAGTSRIVAR